MGKSKIDRVYLGFQLAGHTNRSGMYSVLLRITRGGKTKRLATGLEAKKADWRQSARYHMHYRSSCDMADVYNHRLNKIIDEYQKKLEEVEEDGSYTVDDVINGVEKEPAYKCFLVYARDVTNSIYQEGRIRDWKKHNDFCNKLDVYMKKKKLTELPFKRITPAFLSKYALYLHQLPNSRIPGQRLHMNSVALQFIIFKRILNKAIMIDGLMKIDDNPFLKFKCKEVKTTKEKLEPSEIQAIESLDLEKGSNKWHCRNYFMFSFYCAGIRAGDLIQLRWCNIIDGSRLVYQMGKNHKDRDIVLVPQAKEILSLYKRNGAKPKDYIFPLLDPQKEWAKYVRQEDKDKLPPDVKRDLFYNISLRNAYINRNLGFISQDAGISKKVTMHIARHSFARMAKEQGVDNLILQNLLAHSKLSTTENYMGNFSTSATDAAMVQIFNKPKNKEDELMEQLKELSPVELKSIISKINNQTDSL